MGFDRLLQPILSRYQILVKGGSERGDRCGWMTSWLQSSRQHRLLGPTCSVSVWALSPPRNLRPPTPSTRVRSTVGGAGGGQERCLWEQDASHCPQRLTHLPPFGLQDPQERQDRCHPRYVTAGDVEQVQLQRQCCESVGCLGPDSVLCPLGPCCSSRTHSDDLSRPRDQTGRLQDGAAKRSGRTQGHP